MIAEKKNLCNGKWYHITILHDGKNISVFKNSSLTKTQPFSEVETLIRTHNDLGRGSDQKIHYSTINIDDFRIYNTVLNDNDIHKIYNYKKENHDDNKDKKDKELINKKDKEQDNKKITNDKKTKTANTSSTNSSFNDTFMKYYHKNKIATIAVVSIIGVIVVVLLILFIVKVIVPFVNRLRGKTSEDSSS